MNSTIELFLAAGVAAGALHGALLGWSVSATRAVARVPGPAWAPLLGVVRLAVPGGLLVWAAVSHRLLPALLGWGLGVAFASAIFLLRRRT
jgi:hypothetical protein